MQQSTAVEPKEEEDFLSAGGISAGFCPVLAASPGKCKTIQAKAKLEATAGKIRIDSINSFLSKYISKGAIDMKPSMKPDGGNNSCNPHVQKNQNIDVHKISYV